MVEDKNLSREGNSEDPGKKAAADAARKKPAGKPDESAAKPKKKKNIIIVTGGNSASKGGRQGNSRGNYSSGTGRYDNAGSSAPGRDRDGKPRQARSGSQPSGRDGAGRGADRKPRQGNAQDRNQAGSGRRNQGGGLEAQRQYRPIRPTVVPTVMEVDFHKEPAPVKAEPRPETKAP
ncbi:MAG: hypothetical protein IIU47_10090, partial [Lachnospiraceae bacterium]|nr:hypothetical protein [Lachnospiraceae bacterium]